MLGKDLTLWRSNVSTRHKKQEVCVEQLKQMERVCKWVPIISIIYFTCLKTMIKGPWGPCRGWPLALEPNLVLSKQHLSCLVLPLCHACNACRVFEPKRRCESALTQWHCEERQSLWIFRTSPVYWKMAELCRHYRCNKMWVLHDFEVHAKAWQGEEHEKRTHFSKKCTKECCFCSWNTWPPRKTHLFGNPVFSRKAYNAVAHSSEMLRTRARQFHAHAPSLVGSVHNAVRCCSMLQCKEHLKILTLNSS